MLAFAAPPKIPRTPTRTKPHTNKPCKECLYYENGGCRLFKYSFALHQIEEYANAEDCRRDVSLCGPDGNYFKLKSK